MPTSPFNLDNNTAYQQWRDQKLANAPTALSELIVEIKDPRQLSRSEQQAILDRCSRANMAIYVSPCGDDPDKDIPLRLGAAFGLKRLDHNRGADDDALSALQVTPGGFHGSYIPYTDRPIHWHTDGYYNSLDHQVRGLLLHCVRAAKDGGENGLMDHELAYIQLREQDPQWIRALMQPDAMTIPANIVDGEVLRPDRSGPVISVAADGRLMMRYTARARHVIWKDDPALQAAVTWLKTGLTHSAPHVFHATLRPGWGLVSNNVLHDRSGFDDDPGKPRLLYRARYYDRIAGT